MEAAVAEICQPDQLLLLLLLLLALRAVNLVAGGFLLLALKGID